MIQALYVLLTLAAAGAAFAWFARLEKTGRLVHVVAAIMVLLLVDAVLYPSQNEVPSGLLHPTIGSVSFRPVDLAIPVALAARLWVRGLPTRMSWAALAWLAVLAWIATAALTGLYAGNDSHLVSFEAKAIIYLGALFLAAGVPFSHYLDGDRPARFLRAAALVALVLIVTDTFGVAISLDVPVLPLVDTGRIGGDAATLFASLGIVALVLGAVGAPRGRTLLLSSAPLLAATFASDQRAAFLGVAASLALVAVLLTVSRRRVAVTPTEVGLVTLAVVACLLTPAVAALAAGANEFTLPYEDRLSVALFGREEELTTQDRLNQWREAVGLVGERPVLGWGLGTTYVYYEPGLREFEEINLTHNVVMDMALRTGLVGAGLFLLALALSASAGLRAWLRQRDDVAAAFALGAVAVLSGVLAKGMVESILEKYRLAVLLGLSVGFALSAAAALEPAAARPARRLDPSPALRHRSA